MHLNDEQQNKILEHLNKALKKPLRCPVCEDANWGITDEIFEIRGFYEGDKQIGSVPTTPIITVTCENCGNVLLFNASIVGILEPPKKKRNYQPRK